MRSDGPCEASADRYVPPYEPQQGRNGRVGNTAMGAPVYKGMGNWSWDYVPYVDDDPHQMSSDDLRRGIAANNNDEPATEYVQSHEPGEIYEVDGNDSLKSGLYPELSPIEDNSPDFIPSKTMPTIDLLEDSSGQEWSAQSIEYLRKSHEESPPVARLRVVDV